MKQTKKYFYERYGIKELHLKGLLPYVKKVLKTSKFEKRKNRITELRGQFPYGELKSLVRDLLPESLINENYEDLQESLKFGSSYDHETKFFYTDKTLKDVLNYWNRLLK